MLIPNFACQSGVADLDSAASVQCSFQQHGGSRQKEMPTSPHQILAPHKPDTQTHMICSSLPNVSPPPLVVKLHCLGSYTSCLHGLLSTCCSSPWPDHQRDVYCLLPSKVKASLTTWVIAMMPAEPLCNSQASVSSGPLLAVLQGCF